MNRPRLFRWVIGGIIAIAVAVLAVPAALCFYTQTWPPPGTVPWRLISALSRPASDVEMQEIAVAAIPRTVPAIFREIGDKQVFSVAISGHDPDKQLLQRLSHDNFMALPASTVHVTDGTPDVGQFIVDIGHFNIAPFGTANGMIVSQYGNLGCEGWRFSLRKQDGKWTVISQTTEIMC